MWLQMLILVIESGKEATAQAMSNLLKALYDACYITTDQMTQGFVRVLDNLTDIQLDSPLAVETFDSFADVCFKQGFLPNRVLKELPGRLVIAILFLSLLGFSTINIKPHTHWRQNL